MEMNLDFSEIPTDNLVPEGAYPISVVKAEMRDSRSSSTVYLNLQLRITDGDNAGRMLWSRLFLTEKSLWRTKKAFNALGIGDEKITLRVDEATNLLLHPALVDRSGIAVVKHEDHQGRVSANVVEILAADGVENTAAAFV